jgi:hypothetical protein
MTILKYACLFVAAMPIIGCSTTQNQTDKSQVNLAGYPPAFQDGYADGCNSARRAIGKIRDEKRFEADSMYASGWRDGFDICSETKYE